jgi:predicted outer membrane protein
MDFSQLINDYMNIKRLRGMTPSSRESAQIFAPYFNRQAQNNIEGQRLNLAERGQALAEQAQAAKQQQATEGLAWDKEKAINALALQKWQNQELMSQAGRGDTNATIGNTIGTGASALGNYWLMKKYGLL